MFLHIISADYLDNYQIKIQFSDHRAGMVDLVDSLTGAVFKPLQDSQIQI